MARVAYWGGGALLLCSNQVVCKFAIFSKTNTKGEKKGKRQGETIHTKEKCCKVVRVKGPSTTVKIRDDKIFLNARMTFERRKTN